MYPFLPAGTIRDAVTDQPEAGTRRRRNPLRAMVRYTGALAARATWSPTR